MGGTASKRDSSFFGFVTAQTPPIKEQYTSPSGLYPNANEWDLKFLRRMVLNRKIAPLYPGKEQHDAEEDLEECPICFLYYPGLNRSNCCKKGICTECYIQIKKPSSSATCPFCNKFNYTIAYTGVLSKEEKEKDAEEQQKVIELKIKIRNEEVENDKIRERAKSLTPQPTPFEHQSPLPGDRDIDKSPVSQSLPITPHTRQLSNRSTETSPMLSREYSTSYPPTFVTFSATKTREKEKEKEKEVEIETETETEIEPTNNQPHKENTDLNWKDLMVREEYELALAISLSLQNQNKEPEDEQESENEAEENNETQEQTIAAVTPPSPLSESSNLSIENSSILDPSSLPEEMQEEYELALAISLSLQKND